MVGILPSIGVVAATLMALNGNWFSVAPAIWAVTGTYTAVPLAVVAIVDAAVSPNADPLLVASAAAALIEVTGLSQ